MEENLLSRNTNLIFPVKLFSSLDQILKFENKMNKLMKTPKIYRQNEKLHELLSLKKIFKENQSFKLGSTILHKIVDNKIKEKINKINQNEKIKKSNFNPKFFDKDLNLSNRIFNKKKINENPQEGNIEKSYQNQLTELSNETTTRVPNTKRKTKSDNQLIKRENKIIYQNSHSNSNGFSTFNHNKISNSTITNSFNSSERNEQIKSRLKSFHNNKDFKTINNENIMKNKIKFKSIKDFQNNDFNFKTPTKKSCLSVTKFIYGNKIPKRTISKFTITEKCSKPKERAVIKKHENNVFLTQESLNDYLIRNYKLAENDIVNSSKKNYNLTKKLIKIKNSKNIKKTKIINDLKNDVNESKEINNNHETIPSIDTLNSNNNDMTQLNFINNHIEESNNLGDLILNINNKE